MNPDKYSPKLTPLKGLLVFLLNTGAGLDMNVVMVLVTLGGVGSGLEAAGYDQNEDEIGNVIIVM
jgi:hypothetical protein